MAVTELQRYKSRKINNCLTLEFEIMKNLNSFKAFELGKAQMNAIAGGEIYCVEENAGGLDRTITYSDGVSLEDARRSAEQILDNPICEEVIKV